MSYLVAYMSYLVYMSYERMDFIAIYM